MVTITKNVVLLSAVIAAALVAAFETSAPRAENSPAAVQVAQRFPLTSEMFTPVPITYLVAKKFTAAQKAAAAQKAHRQPALQFCAMTPRGWPYVSHECRVAAGGIAPILSS
jgi:hypothetical protein